MLHIPAGGRKTRWLILFYGMAVFLWLGPEDTSIIPVTLLGGGLSALIVFVWTLHKAGGSAIPARWVPVIAMVLGGATGLGASAFTVGLMFFKNARHAHVFLDYPVGLMLAIVERAPVWAAAGGLLGLAVSLLWLARREQH